VPSEREQRNTAAPQFVAALGAEMAAANYPVTMVRGVMEQTARAYGLDHEFLTLPNYVQVGSPTGEGMYIANSDFDVRYDQSLPLAQLVTRAPTGTISHEVDMAELDRIRNQRRRFPIWLTIIGYAVQSTGLALILQPTPWSLVGAASLGLMVGALSALGCRVEAVGYLLPTICSFLVALIVFSFNNRWHVGVDSLRALAAPHATFLPGAAITLAVIELSTHHVVSGASRLVAGFMQITDTNLVTTEINRLGNAVLGSYASGFGGGLTLIICALAISHLPNTPPCDPAPRHPQHRRVHRHADLDDVDRGRRADRAAAMAGGDPADLITERAGHA
jgi:uncharacterized membrane protein YjjP (DUF1212 family)